jgi:hypothetical protein
MTKVTTRKFCCCIPTRIGAVIIATIGLVGGGALAIGAALNAHNIQGNKAPVAISIVIYILLSIVSLLGLIGAIGRKLLLIKIYFVALIAHLIFSFIIGIYALHIIFKDGGVFISHCVAANSHLDNSDKICHHGLKVIKGVTVTLFIIVWLFEIWAIVIVREYNHQLREELVVEGVVKDTEAW